MKTQKNFWPLGIILTFVVFFIGMASVVIIAATHRDHLVSDNYYEQELKFQTQIDDAARARAVGATIQYEAAVAKVIIRVPVAQLAQKFSGKVTFYRADAPKLDRESLLEPKADGTQTVELAPFAAGPWRVRVQWTADDKNYFIEEKITVAKR